MTQQVRGSAAAAPAAAEADVLTGFPSKRRHLLPKEILGVETRSFDHEAPQPTTNPDLTVWALMNALKQCSSRVIPLPRQDQASINSSAVRSSELTHTANPRVTSPHQA